MMTEEPSVFPSIGAVRTRMILLAVAVSTPATMVMAYFLTQLLGLSSEEWGGIGIASAISTTLMGVATCWPLARVDAQLARFLEDPGGASADLTRGAFRTVIVYPRRLQQLLLASWVGGSLLIGVSMMAMGYEGWGVGFRFAALVIVATSCGMLSATAFFFLAKHELESLRDQIAACIADPEVRRALITPMPLARKMQAVVVGSAVASLCFTVAVSYTRTRDAMDEQAVAWQGRVLDAVAGQASGQDLAASLSQVMPRSDLAAFDVSFFVLGDGTASPELEAIVSTRVQAGRESGSHSVPADAWLASWRTLADGRVLVGAISRDRLPYVFVDARETILMVLVLCTALCLGLAWLLTRDVTSATRALRREAERMAGGDLRRGRIFESEDELGDLSRDFERMGASLRDTVARVVEAADRVDTAAVQISGVADGVSSASADQVRRIQQASELMLRINDQVTAVAGSAQALNESVEESSSSILELGAAGEELNDTASALSERVDEVSSSIEEMVRSVKQVSANSVVLTDAAVETSSSMEEMASAMRVVDTTAEMTAELSREVVTSAEKGQKKVSETIDGIGVIRDSTDVLERVIAGLAQRADEVGAILDVIDDVADETNLLALNAAIIAAQAGEHGRAFSVVAEEIKELADRVLASTKEIGGQIRAVQEESSNAALAIEEGSRSVAVGVERSAEAGVSLEEITRASRESGTRIGEILTAVREQTRAAAHVVELMDRVRGGVEEITAAGAEQDRGNEVVFRSSIAMREVAQQVRRTTDEQARGFGRIRESVEGVRAAVEQINGSLQEQSSACGQVAEFLEQVYERTRSNEQAAQRMGESTGDLVAYAQALREDIAKFRT